MEILKSLLLALATFGLIYLIGCFGYATFDISKWDLDIRFVIAFIGFILSGAVFFTSYNIQNK